MFALFNSAVRTEQWLPPPASLYFLKVPNSITSCSNVQMSCTAARIWWGEKSELWALDGLTAFSDLANKTGMTRRGSQIAAECKCKA